MSIPLTDSEERFDRVDYQGKVIAVGDTVVVPEAGQRKQVVVTSLIKRQNHYWVGYNQDQRFCPWPLVQPATAG